MCMLINKMYGYEYEELKRRFMFLTNVFDREQFIVNLKITATTVAKATFFRRQSTGKSPGT